MELEFKQNTNEMLYGLVAVTFYVLYVQSSVVVVAMKCETGRKLAILLHKNTYCPHLYTHSFGKLYGGKVEAIKINGRKKQ